ncbi:MAG TPA: glycosyltransferase family 2 protein [Chitinophagaceae bacterium]|jgi:glycosyltransferase involved in cell wall biosynthesis|nr:glycosyltransferase family 2 protein [Chitinophagaceae bacterium]
MTATKKNTVYIVIPAFNEQEVIRDVLNSLLQYPYTIVVVDDGSTPSLKEPLSDIHDITYIRHKVNLGQGAALQTGIDYALRHNADYIVTFDADGQHSPTDIEKLLTPLQNKEAAVALGSRFLEKNMHNAPASRTWILKAGRWVNYFFTGLYLSDAHNGLRAMTREAAGKIHLKENRMAHATEFLFLIRKHKLAYKEVPTVILYTDYSKAKGQSVFNSIRIFFDLVLHKLFE